MRRKTLATMAKHSFAEHNLLVEAESLEEGGETNMNASEEERVLFPKAEKLLGEKTLLSLGRAIQERKSGRSATA